MAIGVTFSDCPSVSRIPVEFVERKGKGHPDTLCDRAAEELSIALCEYYTQNFGRIFHHNVDKCILVGGQAQAWFGGGNVSEPIQITIVGRAADKIDGRVVPVERIARETTAEWLSKEMHHLDVSKHVRVGTQIRSGSADLVKNFDLYDGVPLSNDTSFGVSYAPLTETEQLVLSVENELNSEGTKRLHPGIGEDIKVMGVRQGSSINLTVACAMISDFIPGEGSYGEAKEIVRDIAMQTANRLANSEISIHVNAADNLKTKLFYLTVTGTSAEHGDDGQVGRGNRANGLITPFRPMTLEASAGKNPVNHTGKMYNVVANKIVHQVQKEYPSVEQVSCYVVSQIGRPITEPQAVNVELNAIRSNSIENDVKSIVRDRLREIPNLWMELIKREHSLF